MANTNMEKMVGPILETCRTDPQSFVGKAQADIFHIALPGYAAGPLEDHNNATCDQPPTHSSQEAIALQVQELKLTRCLLLATQMRAQQLCTTG